MLCPGCSFLWGVLTTLTTLASKHDTLTEAPSPIQLQNVSFDYDTAPLLHDVSHTFAAHAVTAVFVEA